jgi:hypothetical protein
MKRRIKGKDLVRFILAPACTLAVVLFLLFWSMRTHAQNNAQAHLPVHQTTDWSTRHMVYSAPSSSAQAQRLQAEQRYLQQWARRNSPAPQVPGAQ